MHASVCDFIVDCLQNSIEAEAMLIQLTMTETEFEFSVRIVDDGKGMTDEQRCKAVDPFYSDGSKHKARRVGLGLPFMVQAVELSGGRWTLDSEKGKGTEVFFQFPLQHVDTPPVGDISGMLLQVLMFDGAFELKIERILSQRNSTKKYQISRSELIDALGDINSADSLIMAKQFLQSQEEYLIIGEN